ncbi:MAG: hypothetical protein GX856_02650, partial [Gammaproteobacteria bacterium]|nr:hypothetical protein [Gammaproteobacteria bacterium]
MRDAVASALEMSAPAIARWLQEVGDRDPHAGLQFAVALARLIQPRPPKAAPEPPAEVIHGVNVATLAPPEPQTRTWTHDRYGLGAPTATPAPAPPVVPDPDGTPVVTISRPRPTPPPPRRDDGVDTVYNPL